MRHILEIQKKAFIENGQPTYNQRLDSLKRCIALLETHEFLTRLYIFLNCLVFGYT